MGKTGLQLSALSFGSWVTFGKQIDEKIAESLLSTAYDAGVNFFDNAEVYALGQSERVMGKIFKKKKWDRTSYTLSSKVFFGHRGANNRPNQTGLSRKHVTEACHEALQRLQTDYLDLYLCHRPDKNTPIEETVWTMTNLIEQGKVLYWGTSEWSAAEIVEAHAAAKANNLIAPSVEQPQYNLFVRDKMEVEYYTIFKNLGMGTTIWSPLASGVLTGKYNKATMPKGTRLGIKGFEWLKERELNKDRLAKVAKLQTLGNELGCSVANLSIAWTLCNPNVTTTILGASNKKQLKETLTSLDVLPLLTPSVLATIENIMDNKPIMPQY
jgi:voltage-dependent potassium channel beta subunit